MEKEDFIILNKQFIPGPYEKKEEFFKRINLTKELYFEKQDFFKKRNIPIPFSFKNRMKKPDFNWVLATLLNLFDIFPSYALAYHCNHKLSFFQGAATWILDVEKIPISILQIRKKRKFLSLDIDDILAHELVHFSRAAFSEDKYEEFFAYLTSGNILRKIFGPLSHSKKEIFFFFGVLSFSCIVSLFSSFLYFLFSFFSFIFLLLGFIRLGKRRFIFNRCLKKLKKITKEKKKALYIMFRLKDEEIEYFAKTSKDEILKYIKKNKNNSYRWKIIWNSYFL